MDAKRFARISVARRGTLLALLLAAATGSAEVPDGFAPVVDGGPVRTIAIQSDGAIVFGGGFSTVDGEPRNGLARVRTDGALDESYAPLDGQPAKDVHEVAVQFDGRLLYTTTLGANVLRLHPDGSADATWIGRECVGPQFALQADGKVVAPDACSGPDDPPLAMERLLPDGTLDTGFAAPTRTPGSKVTAIFARADGKIIFVGDFQKIGNANRPDIMRLMPSGQADPSPI
ncbi:MAG TPA: delta-60 repeat domain-containing protein, partial [Rhodanobacteraceae bacterium]|nr:delta-60 repeat domain-containing protein [Rhodanobacteraceae bacterium]